MILSRDNMVKKGSQIEALTLAIVRGEMPLDALTKIGLDLESENGFYKLKSGNFVGTVTPSACDVSLGILRYSSADKNDIRKWAFFLLAESGAIDLSGLESHPYGEILISALWEASFEGCIGSETIDLAQRLTLTKR